MLDEPDDPATDDQQPTRTEAGRNHATGNSAPRQRLGDFDLLREIGRGGMGVVYEARQLSLNRRVALKVLPPGLGLTEQAVKRFEREAHAAAKLHHTGIVPVYATGQEDGCHYYAMELIEGQALSEVLKDLSAAGSNPLIEETVSRLGGEETVPGTSTGDTTTRSGAGSSGITSLSDTGSGSRKWFDVVARLISEVADALHYAHGRGVIHRDIKPANLMLSNDGRLCITDFGLARVAQEPGMTVSGSLMGTPAYMSPEQITAGRVKLDHRTDVYSLGTVLYELLTHQRPFPGDSREEVLSRILSKDPRPPRRFNPRVPLDLETICLKAMEKDPDKRYATAEKLADDLKQYLQHGLISARRAGPIRRMGKSMRMHPVATTVTVAVIVVGLLGTLSWRALTGEQAAGIERRVSDARLMLTQGDLRGALDATNEILASDTANVDGLLIRARVSLQRYHYREAVDDARRVLTEDPENWEGHLLVAAAAKKGKLYSIPVDEHLAVVETSVPDTADAYFLLGLLAAYDWGRAREAIGWLDKALELNPGHALALETRSDEYERLKNLPAAMADAERLIAANPLSIQGYIEKASNFLEMHDQHNALAMANKAIELDPENSGGYAFRSNVHRERGQTSDRIADLTRAIEMDPTARRYSRRAEAYRANGDTELAIADARQSIDLEPDCGLCYSTLFHTYWGANRREEAIDLLDELEKRAADWVQDEGQIWRHVLWRDYYVKVEDYQRALEHATRWGELQPRTVAPHAGRLYVRRLAGGDSALAEDCDRLAALELDTPSDFNYRGSVMNGSCNREHQALDDYARAIKLAPDWADPYVRRSNLHKKNKRFDEALTDMTRAIELAPNWVDAYFWRGQTYADMERFEEALADYERDIELGGEGRNLRAHQAEALLRLGREAEALEVLDAFIDKNPANASVHMNRAWALVRLGRLDEGLASADRAVESRPGWPMTYWERAAYRSSRPGMCAQVHADMTKVEELASGPVWSTARALLMVLNFHYSCPDLSDVAGALTLAREGVEYSSESGYAQGVYGFALFRNERFDKARDVLLDALELSNHEDEVDLFFLAMTLSRLGDARQARSYYNRAVARMNATFPKTPITVLVRDEAAEVLGVEIAEDD